MVPLIDALKDEDPHVRENVAKALGNIKDARSIGPLSIVLKDKKSNVQDAAFEALSKVMGGLKDSNEIELLTVALKSNERIV